LRSAANHRKNSLATGKNSPKDTQIFPGDCMPSMTIAQKSNCTKEQKSPAQGGDSSKFGFVRGIWLDWSSGESLKTPRGAGTAACPSLGANEHWWRSASPVGA